VDGRMRPSLRGHRGKRKQVPPLRRRMRYGSGRNDKARASCWLRFGRNDNRWEHFHSGKTVDGRDVHQYSLTSPYGKLPILPASDLLRNAC
jgi:hypothetical protein